MPGTSRAPRRAQARVCRPRGLRAPPAAQRARPRRGRARPRTPRARSPRSCRAPPRRRGTSGLAPQEWSSKSSSLSSGQLPTPLEPLDAAAAQGSALEPGVGRMTARASVDNQLAPGGASGKGVAARGAADGSERELRMNLLQGNLLLRGGARTQNPPRAAVPLRTLATPQLFPVTT